MSYFRYITLACCILCTLGAFAKTNAPDTLVPANIEYQGYRLHIRKVQVIKQRDREAVVRLDVINTGKRPIQLGPGFPQRFLQTKFDNSLAANGNDQLAGPIRVALVSSRMSFAVGQWAKDIELSVNRTDTLSRISLTTDDFDRREPTIRRRQREASTTLDSTKSAISTPRLADCIDLSVERVEKVFADKNSTTVQITLKNVSTKVLNYSALPEDLAIGFFLSGSPKLTASAKQLFSLNLSNQLAKRGKSTFQVGEKLIFVQRLDTKSATRYTGVLVAQLDAAQLLKECDETNNQAHLLLFD